MEPFDVVAFNVANYDDHHDWGQRLPMVVDSLVATDFDVAGLSEIRYTAKNSSRPGAPGYWLERSLPDNGAGYKDMGEQILTLLRRHDGFEQSVCTTIRAMTYVASLGSESWEGLSILSRLPLLAQGSRCLTQLPGGDGNARATQYTELALASGRSLFVFNLHFALDEADRVSNAEETIAMVSSVVTEGCPYVLLGDLNAQPGDEALQRLADAGLRDAWAAEYPDQPGYTHEESGRWERIDYVWVPPDVTIQSGELIARNPNLHGVYASDHFGLHFTLAA